jgi:hypothetical protein
MALRDYILRILLFKDLFKDFKLLLSLLLLIYIII